MWEDPIVKETRELREQYASQHNHDIDAIFEDIQHRQSESKVKVVLFSPREPTQTPKIAQPVAQPDRITLRGFRVGVCGRRVSFAMSL